MAFDRSIPSMLFLAPPATEKDPSELTPGVWHGVGERWLDPFAVEPATGSRPEGVNPAIAGG